MTPEKRKKWIVQEEARLVNYQHQHRGLNFLKLRLPPIADRKVNIVGLDNHVYRGSVPKVPEDELPPEVDKSSIDEEALYKEIRDMNFPPVPPREPLGPKRRIDGTHTLAKSLIVAPVKVDCSTGLEESLLLGKDGRVYRGTTRAASTVELEKNISGSKIPVRKVKQPRSSRGFIKPSIVTLQAGGKPLPFGRKHGCLVELPATNVGKIVELVKVQNKQKPNKEASITESAKSEQDTKKSGDKENKKASEEAQHEESVNESVESQNVGSTEADTEASTKSSQNEESSEADTETATESSQDEESSEADTETATELSQIAESGETDSDATHDLNVYV